MYTITLLLHFIFMILALGISIIAMDDPREFYISCVNEHFPEFQLEYPAFGVSSKGNIILQFKRYSNMTYVCSHISVVTKGNIFGVIKFVIWFCSYMYSMSK